MEDRETPFLYLELSGRAPEDYARERVPEVLALRGVERASWWQNQMPGRSEYPRTLDEFTTLGLFEGSPRFLHLYEMDTGDAESAFQRMTPTTRDRQIGRYGSPLWKQWAGHEQLVIDYVNTFARVGESVNFVER